MRNCNSCGKNLSADMKFCDACGTAVDFAGYQPQSHNQQEHTDFNAWQPEHSASSQHENVDYSTYQSGYDASNQREYIEDYNTYHPGHGAPSYQSAPLDTRGQGFAIAGLVMGIFALILCWFPIVGIIFSILAIVFVVMSRSRGGRGGLWVTALVFTIIGTIAAALFTLLWTVGFFVVLNMSDYFYF